MAAEEPPGGGGPGGDPAMPTGKRKFLRFNFSKLRSLLGLQQREPPLPEEDNLSPLILQAEKQRLQQIQEQLDILQLTEDVSRERSQELEKKIVGLDDIVQALREDIAERKEKQFLNVEEFHITFVLGQ